MTEASATNSTTPPTGGAALEPARMSPAARFLNVFFSPAAVFDDVRRDPRGWWVPILASVLVASVLMGVYYTRFAPFLGEIEANQIRDSGFTKTVMGPEKHDELVQQTLKVANAIPVWQWQVKRIAIVPAGTMMVVWFFAMLYSVICLAMGWIDSLGGWRFALSVVLGLVGGVMTGSAEAVPRIVSSIGMKPGDTPDPAPMWSIVVGVIMSLAACALVFWILQRATRAPGVGRIVAVVAYALSPGAIGAAAGILVAILKTPDPTPFEQLVPSNLGALAGDKGALGALASSLDLFTLWVMVLATIGLSRTLGKRVGPAAAVVFTPWIVWVLLKTCLAAVFA